MRRYRAGGRSVLPLPLDPPGDRLAGTIDSARAIGVEDEVAGLSNNAGSEKGEDS